MNQSARRDGREVPAGVTLNYLLAAVSLANLCFYGVWADLLPGSPRYYFLKAAPPLMGFAAVAANIALLAGLICVAALAVHRSQSLLARRLGDFAFVVVLLLAFNGIRMKLPGLHMGGAALWLGRVALFAAVLFTLVALLRWRKRAVRVLLTLVLVCAPFVAVTFGRAIWALVDRSATLDEFRDQPVAPALPGAHTQRILWMIFDELDERLAFAERPAGVELPQLERLRHEAWFASQAFPPSAETQVSLPALFDGKLFASAWPIGTRELRLHDPDGQRIAWGSAASVFEEARKRQLNSALIGWYHPYCRVLGGLTRCAWEEWKNPTGVSLREQMAQQIWHVAQTIPGARRIGLLRVVGWLEPASAATRRRTFALQRYERMLRAMRDTLADAALDLIVIHWPIPHPPCIYDRFTGDLTAGQRRNGERSNYLDNLVLADRTLGEVRQVLEASGDWQRTTVIVTGDHGYRSFLWTPKLHKDDEERVVIGRRLDHRVPLLIKLANDSGATTYDKEFNTILTRELVLAMLDGEVKVSADIGPWIDTHSKLGRSPYMKEFH